MVTRRRDSEGPPKPRKARAATKSPAAKERRSTRSGSTSAASVTPVTPAASIPVSEMTLIPDHLPADEGIGSSSSRAAAPGFDAAMPSLVVGIGGSAGSLTPLRELFAATPVDSGMAFVVVSHQAPTGRSLLPEILAKGSLKSDAIHPNAAGYRKLAQRVAELIRKSQVRRRGVRRVQEGEGVV